MKLDYNKFVRLGLIGLGVGILLVMASFFITPIFVANHFSSDGIEECTIQRIQSVRLSAVVLGIFAIVLGASIYIYPSTVNRFFDFVLLKGERFQNRYFYLPFCFTCFFIALFFVLLITQSGSGISPDSTSYISTGKNVYSGNGFLIGYPGSYRPYTIWPPFYPLSIAAFMHLGFNAEHAARLVPIFCFAFLMFPLFFIGKVLDDVFTGYIACLMCLIFTPLLWVTSYAWTEMIYIFFSVLAIFFLIKFDESKEDRNKNALLCMCGFFTSLTILTKYIGVTLLLVGLIVILLKSKSQLKKMFYQILLFGSISILPIIPWLYRNITFTSHLSGGNRGESAIGLLTNVNMTVLSLLYDFLLGPIPQLYFNLYFSYVGLAIIATSFILLVVFAKIYPGKRTALLGLIKKKYILFLYIFVYLITLIMLRSRWHFDPINTRLISPVYPFLILVVISCIHYVYRQKKTSVRKFVSVITILCLLFFVIQTSFFYSYAKYGQGYNCLSWRNDQGIDWIESNVPDNATVYSDYADAIEFRLKRPCRYLPRLGNEKAINEFFERLKNEEISFIIGSKIARGSFLSNDEIIETNQKYDVLAVVADFPRCTIYETKDNPC